jgi:hypothetical protein
LQRATEPINRPSGHNVDLPTHNRFQQTVEGWPLVPSCGAADARIDKLIHHRPIAVFGSSLKRLSLVLDRLVSRADPQVESNALGHRIAPIYIKNIGRAAPVRSDGRVGWNREPDGRATITPILRD